MVISEIDLSLCKPYKDFGRGFYCTEIRDQAELMAKRVSRIYGGKSYVNEFEFNDNILNLTELNIKFFDRPTEEWAMFVINNRDRNFSDIQNLNCNFDNKYDLVVGPVADDDLALLFRTFTRGLIDISVLVNGMKYKKLSNQYSFHTMRSLNYLKPIGGYEV